MIALILIHINHLFQVSKMIETCGVRATVFSIVENSFVNMTMIPDFDILIHVLDLIFDNHSLKFAHIRCQLDCSAVVSL